MVKLADLEQFIHNFAPRMLAEDWDNVGIQVGRRNHEIKKIFLALTPSFDVFKRAKEAKADCIVTHHPFIFKGVKQIIGDQDSIAKGIYFLIENQMALFSAHTNLDATMGGVNDVLAKVLSFSALRPLDALEERLYKLVVFVPENDFHRVQQALFDAGAGNQGLYRECSWSCVGEGRFKAMDRASPYLGEIGKAHLEREKRLEVLVSERYLKEVKEALLEVHPYEEVAYDLFVEAYSESFRGIGRIGELEESCTLEALAQKIKQGLSLEVLKISGLKEKKIKRVALCGGSGASYIRLAANQGADCFITGDLKYHDGQLAQELGLALIDVTHFAGEKIMMDSLAAILTEKFPDIIVEVDKQEQDFFYHLT